MSQVLIERFTDAAEVAQVRDARDIPAAGWAIVHDASKGVYKDGTRVGQLVQFETSLEGLHYTRSAQLMYLPNRPEED